MGNSNSSEGQRSKHHHQHGGHGHHPHGHPHSHHDQWSHSLETPEQRNRMKRGYFPPRPFVGLPQPHKVLPHAAVPTKLLKATSNGAILHGGGTISGRKLAELDLEIRKRSTVSCPANGDLIPSSGTSTPNLMRARMNGSSKSSREYDSEPDLREVGVVDEEGESLDNRSVSPLPNSFTLISESPAKKQIRSRKKSKAPPPPGHPGHEPLVHIPYSHNQPPPGALNLMQHPHSRQLILTPEHFMPSPGGSSGGGKKKLNRLFKTKAESKSAAASPGLRSPSGSELMMMPPPSHMNMMNSNGMNMPRGGPMRASLDANRLIRGEKDRVSHHSVEGGLQNLSAKQTSSHPIDRESKAEGLNFGVSGGKMNPKQKNNPTTVVSSRESTRLGSSAPLCSPKGGQTGEVTNHRKHAQQSSSRDASSGLQQVPKNNKSSEKTTTTTTSSANNLRNNNNNNSNNKGLVSKTAPSSTNHEAETKKFYFGMDVGTFSSKKQIAATGGSPTPRKTDDPMTTPTNKAPSGSNNSNGLDSGDFSVSGNLHKEVSRRKMVKQLEEETKTGQRSPSRADNDFEEEVLNKSANSSRQNQNQANIQSQSNHGKQSHKNQNGGGKVILAQTNNNNKNPSAHGNINNNNKPLLSKSNSNNRSESDSDGLHRRQDSGSFELNDSNARKNSRNAPKVNGVIRESSSDLSSSDLDVPLVVTRPTLPQKRPDLPRFSPTAAWRALDSPSRVSISGRSFSSEEGLGHHGSDRINRYTRPSAPPRASNERSGDSGISAGDAGSPANRMPMDMSSSPVMINMNSRGYKPSKNIVNSSKESADRMMKCWTPEQDLDESSSDFEQENILPPVPPPPQSPPSSGNVKISGNNRAVPIGLRTPPKFTTRGNLFEGKRAAAVVSDTDSKYFSAGGGDESAGGGGKRLYSRSAKSKNQNQEINQNPSKKRFNHPQNSPGHNSSKYLNHSPGRRYMESPNRKFKNQESNNNGFLGLDTNWFLSRSEPNSLHHLGVFPDDFDGQFDQNQDQLRRQRDAQLLDKVFPKVGPKPNPKSPNKNLQNQPQNGREVVVGSRKRISKNEQDDDDELECELQLEDEEDSSSDNNILVMNHSGSGGNNHRNNGNKNNKKEVQLRSEIGYGPSCMNFYSPPGKSTTTTAKVTTTTATVHHQSSTSGGSKVTRAKPNGPYYDDYEPETDSLHPEDEDLEEDEEEEEEELMRDDLFDYLDQYEEGEFEREQELTTSGTDAPKNIGNIANIPNQNGNNIITSSKSHQSNSNSNKSNRPFSHHIMYLPSYDSRRVQSNSSNNWRRARSVDHLDTSESTLFRRHRSPVQQFHQPTRGGHFIDVESEDNSSRNRPNFRKTTANSVQKNPNSRKIERLENPRQYNQVRKSSEPCYPSAGSGLGNRSSSVPRYTEEEDEPYHRGRKLTPDLGMNNNDASSLEEAERRALNKKKFKFQSTLRVKERQKIELELSREARQKEEERLRETEAMKKVEEEFQKKRAKEKLEAQAASALANLNGKDDLPPVMVTSSKSFANDQHSKMSNQTRKISTNNYQGSGSPKGRAVLSHQASSSSAASSGMGQSYHQNHQNSQHFQNFRNQGHRRGNMRQRQEPEGAPASIDMNSNCNNSGPTDLRKELISASKKRNANTSIIGGSNQELTQELSEYRQETRQYCDYRRGPRQQSLSPARFAQSSSSDIFPISSRRKGGSSYSGASKASGRSTVHPEVICDIPSKPQPYMVNASRLSGSNVNLVSEERPNSGLGSTNNLSSPSSVISDNYRKDWAHHYQRSGGSIIQGGRASSVISLHSAPGYSSSENFRNSTSDLSRVHPHNGPSDLPSPRFLRDRGNRVTRQYSTSPPSTSPVPPRGSSNDSTATESIHPMDSRGSPVRITSRSHTTVISIGTPMPKSDPFQAQPYNKVKGYRPVAFKPTAVQ